MLCCGCGVPVRVRISMPGANRWDPPWPPQQYLALPGTSWHPGLGCAVVQTWPPTVTCCDTLTQDTEAAAAAAVTGSYEAPDSARCRETGSTLPGVEASCRTPGGGSSGSVAGGTPTPRPLEAAAVTPFCAACVNSQCRSVTRTDGTVPRSVRASVSHGTPGSVSGQ
ncbi:hypothetical protein O3P69_012890 [Scylla paramamosain]|uniref:Uncharacterized protein n=1 Tax=Scylla paramamosain TaxID=85552 RepID=A0AAW0TR48_SCYPA